MANKNAKQTKTAAKATSKKAEAVKTAKAAPKAEPKKAAAPTAENDGELVIHINKTGRVCFGKTAADRIGDAAHMAITVTGKAVRMVPAAKATDDTTEVRSANGRPYVSATRILKPLGFDGTRPYDVTAKAITGSGLEFSI